METLTTLKFNNVELLTKLQMLSPLAGSAAAIPCLANDVDFFILNNDEMTLYAMFELLKPYIVEIKRLCQSSYDETEVRTSVFTFVLKNEVLPVQLILTSYKTVHDLINNFDFDYIQVAVFQNQRIVNQYTDEALKNSQIGIIQDWTRYSRFEKIIQKSIKTPIFCNLFTSQHIEEPVLDFYSVSLKPISVCRLPEFITSNDSKQIHCKDLQIVDAIFEKGWTRKNTSSESLRFFTFILKSQSVIFKVKNVCFVWKITKLEKRETKTIVCVSDPLFSQFNIRYKDMDIKENKTYGCLVQLCSSGNGTMRLEIQKVLDPNFVIPIPVIRAFLGKCEILSRYGLADPTHSRQLTDAAIDVLIQQEIDLFKNDKTDNYMNHICASAYRALAYDRNHDNDGFAYMRSAKQFAYDIEKHFGDNRVLDALGDDFLTRMCNNNQSRTQISSFGDLRRFINQHKNKRQKIEIVNHVC